MSENLQPGMNAEQRYSAALVADHLDPDQLNAFAEGVLPEHERVVVMAHLADCSDCRAIVFLARQAEPIPEPATELKATSSWRSWLNSGPFFLAATAGLACALVVAVVLHVHHAEPQSSLSTAKMEAPVTPPVPESAASAPSLADTPAPVAPPSPAPAPASKMAMSESRTVQPPAARSAPVVATDFLTAPGAASSTPQAGYVPNQNQTGTSMAKSPVYGPAPQQQNVASQQGYVNQMSVNQNVSVTTAGAAVVPPPPPPPPVAASAARSREPELNGVMVNNQVALNTLGDVNAAGISLKTVPPAKPDDKILPSHEQVVSVAARGERVLAIDAQGSVFMSSDSGHNWTQVRSPWLGKAVRVTLAQRPTTSHAHALEAPAEDVARYSAPAPQAEAAKKARSGPSALAESTPFQLTTETGQVWTSTDGLTWKER